MTEASEVAEADALTPPAATLADTRQAEAARPERVPDGVAEHVAARALLVLPRRLLAAPRRRGRVRVPAAHRRDEANHAELRGLLESRLLREVRIRIVLGTLDTVLVPAVLRVGVTHRPLFPLGARPGAALLLVGVRLGDLLGLALLL